MIGRTSIMTVTATLGLLVLVALAAPTAGAVTPAGTVANEARITVEAVMTLHLVGSDDWRLDIQNAAPVGVTIRQIRWNPPPDLKIERIVATSGGRCRLSSDEFRCQTRLAGRSCPTCDGSDLIVHFEGTRPKGKWVTTSSGAYWKPEPLQSGHAVLIGSEDGRAVA